jgi:hypothetical protein
MSPDIYHSLSSLLTRDGTWFATLTSGPLDRIFAARDVLAQMPCSRARRTSSSAATCSAVGSGLFFVTVSSVTLITAPLPLNTRLSDQGRKHF